MQLVYCFIEDYINIYNQGFNFGSPFILSVEVTDNEITIDRTDNPAYIEGLFPRKSKNRISNVTAIVGENGTGKTNVLNFLRNSFCRDTHYADGFLILMDERKQLHLVSHSRKRISSYFDFETKKPNRANTIYYNPIYDFNQYYLDHDPRNFDVSSNRLMREDFEEDRFLSETIDHIEFHVFKNISRQVRFITRQKFSRRISRDLNLPKLVDVVFINPKLPHDGKSLDNVSDTFRKYYTIGVELWREEQSNIHHAKSLEENKPRKRRSFAIQRRYALNGAMFNLWKFLFFSQEQNNSTLREGIVKFETQEIEGLKKLTFQEYITAFFSHQNIFEEEPITAFIVLIKGLIQKSRNFTVEDSDYIAFETELGNVDAIFKAYAEITQVLSTRLLHGDKPHGFLQFKWHNLSSGERAFLDLFARFSYGKTQIEDYVAKNEDAIFPDVLYLFIDEGELGFHLQWQKEYVKTLIEVLPEIFRFGDKSPDIQIIFTTHSPISLSDIPRYNTIYLKKDEEYLLSVVTETDSPKHSFGANIHEIMYDAFYLKDGFIGNFAREVIDEIFIWGNNGGGKDLTQQYIRGVINIVDDPILRLKLEELFAEKYKYNLEEEILKIKITQMQKRLSEIRKNDKNRDQ